MNLQELMALSSSHNKKQGMSEERLAVQVPHLRKLIAFYREYPDLLVDFMCGPDGGPNHFHFYFY